MEVDYDNNTAGIWVVIVSTVIYFIRTILRRGAKDMAEIKTEMSQGSYIEALRADNDQLRADIAAMAKERNEALSRIGALEARLEIALAQCEKKSVILNRCPVLNDGQR